jgi:hypothetical protein
MQLKEPDAFHLPMYLGRATSNLPTRGFCLRRRTNRLRAKLHILPAYFAGYLDRHRPPADEIAL